MNEPINLFQQKALEHQKDGWMGDIVLVRPLLYGILTAVLAAMAIGAVVYMVAGSYTKRARVSGYIVPDQGLLARSIRRRPGSSWRSRSPTAMS